MKMQLTTQLLTWIAVAGTCFFLVFFASQAFSGVVHHIISDGQAGFAHAQY